MTSSGAPSTTSARMAAAGAVLGGGMWAAHALVLATRPEGCIAQGCTAGASHRETEDVAWLFLASLALITMAAALLAADDRWRGRALIGAATALLVAGSAAVAAGIVVNAVVSDSAFWWLHDTDSLGRFLPVLGSAFAGIAMLRKPSPWWRAGAALIIGAVLSLGFNAQNARVLFTLPLGVAWAAVGYEASRR